MRVDSAPSGPVRGGAVPSPKQVILQSELQVAEVGTRPLAGDAESAVFELPHDPAVAARIYARPTPELAERLGAMIADPPTDPQAGRGQPAFAWPTDRLLQVGSFQTCLGYAMPWVSKARTLEHLCDPSTRLAQGPLLDHGQLLQVARHLAAAFRALHAHGHATGPLRPSRVLVGDSGLVTLADTASFQIRTDSRVFPCAGGADAYDAPELQPRGANATPLAECERGPEQDAFTLAVLVYRLLTLGAHPLLNPAQGRTSLPPAALPPAVQDLFRQCFGPGRDRPELRPDAARWEDVLALAEAELVKCSVGTRHRYHRDLAGCPWCERVRISGQDPFPAQLPAQPGTTLLGRRTGRVATGVAGAFAADGLEGTRMSDGVNDFELEADASPADPPHPAPLPPPEPAPPMALEYLPPLDALPPVPPAAGTAPNPPRRSSFRPWLVGIILLGLAANAVLLAYRQGWVSFPALRGKTDDGTPVAKKDPTTQKEDGISKGEGKAKANGSSAEKAGKGNGTSPSAARPILNQKDVLSAIQDNLYKTPLGDRKYKRYFTLTHLHNDPRVSEAELEQHRAALTGLLKHLAGSPGSSIAESVDKARTVYVVDLQRLGWPRAEAWREVLKQYPYALNQAEAAEEQLAELAREVYELSDADVPAVRADWFIVAASEPPLKELLSAKAVGDPPANRSAIDRYRRPLDLAAAAAELGLADAKALAEAIRTKTRLSKLGLEPLAREGGRLPREVWSSTTGLVPFQEAAKELDLGIPYRVR